MYLVRHKKFQDYKTIKKDDLYKMKSFKNFEVIKDENEISSILKEHFNSKNRGDPYDPLLPSCTQIVGELYPIDFAKEYGLIKWMDARTKVHHSQTRDSSNTAMTKGTVLHKVLEDYLIDKNIIGEDFEPYLSTTDCINELDKEIIETLENFKIKESGKIKLVHSEMFLKTSYTQGTVDLICDYEGRLTLGDWKTTSKIDKKNSKPRFSYKSEISQYLRQLALYTIMLEDVGILTKEQIDNLDYKIFQFHFILKDYKMFEIPREEVFSLQKDIIKVIAWYRKMIK